MANNPTEQELHSLLGADIPVLPIPKVLVKRTEKYTIKIPEDPDNLHIQIFFNEPWSKMVNSKKVFKVQAEVSKMISALDIPYEFEVTIIPDEQSLYIGANGYLKSLTSTILDITDPTEKVLAECL